MKLLQAIAAALIALLAAVAYNSASAQVHQLNPQVNVTNQVESWNSNRDTRSHAGRPPRPDYVINDVVYRSEFKQYANEVQIQRLRRKLLNEVAVDREYAGNAQLVALDIELLGHDAPAWTGAMCDNIQRSAFSASSKLRALCGK